jgi:hypothetical protein
MSEVKTKSKEQPVAEADVESHRKDLGPFVVAAETTRMAMTFTDAKEPVNPIVFANDSFLSLTGFDRTEILGRSFNSLLARGADACATARVSAACKGGQATDPEVHYRRLSALSRSHDLLTRENWTSGGLRDIVIDALEPFGVSGALAARLAISGDNIRLSPKVKRRAKGVLSLRELRR